MNKPADIPPAARNCVMDARLERPDWTTGANRPQGLLWLDKNENTDPELLEVTQRIFRELDPMAIASYPDSAVLYRKLGNSLGVSARHLLLAAGSDGVIRSAFEAFVRPGDVVIHTGPTFAMYPVYSLMYGAQTVVLEYEPSSDGPRLSVERVTEAIERSRARLVCLPNPDSPTGTVFEPDALKRIVSAAASCGSVMLVDEAYYPFYDQSCIGWVGQYPNLIIARTFAKAWGIAGLRAGYGVAGPALAGLLHKVRPMYELNTVAVFLLERLLDHADAIEASVTRLNAGKAAFLSGMERLGLRTLPAHGNFCHVAFDRWSAAVHEALRELVLYRRDFSEPCLKGFSRFSSTTPRLIAPVIERIAAVVGRQH